MYLKYVRKQLAEKLSMFVNIWRTSSKKEATDSDSACCCVPLQVGCVLACPFYRESLVFLWYDGSNALLGGTITLYSVPGTRPVPAVRPSCVPGTYATYVHMRLLAAQA